MGEQQRSDKAHKGSKYPFFCVNASPLSPQLFTGNQRNLSLQQHFQADERAATLTRREKGQVSDGTEEIRDWQRTGRPAVQDKAPGGKRMPLRRITTGTGAGPPHVCYKVQNAVRPILIRRENDHVHHIC